MVSQQDIDAPATLALLSEVVEEVRGRGALDAVELDHLVRAFNRALPKGAPARAKKMLLPAYARQKGLGSALWRDWRVTPVLERDLVSTLRMKPSRTARGVAAVTVLTKPWPCTGGCLFCPCDASMPKSYLSDEPACQRAAQNEFDPYLQATSRLSVLRGMGHRIDRVELIVLGGTWDDYPASYRCWFVSELFRALNQDEDDWSEGRKERFHAYRRAEEEATGPEASSTGPQAGKGTDAAPCADQKPGRGASASSQTHSTKASAPHASTTHEAAPDEGPDAEGAAYNRTVARLNAHGARAAQARWQKASFDDAEAMLSANARAPHRCTGLSVETRPERVNDRSLDAMRRLGVTRVQLGVQSLDDNVLRANLRHASAHEVARSFWLVRSHGLKLHAHFMANLYESTPKVDVQGFRTLVSDPAFVPDEVKLYPCALVQGTGLYRLWEQGEWRPYAQDELLDVLARCMKETPPHVRVSRMIRDIPSGDIVVGNKHINLRQAVQRRLQAEGARVDELRERSAGLSHVDPDALVVRVRAYKAAFDGEESQERFLELASPDGKVVGVARISMRAGVAWLREAATFDDTAALDLPGKGEASNEEAHDRCSVGERLRSRLVSRALDVAREGGCTKALANCAAGEREDYEALGFSLHDGVMEHTL